MAQVISPKDNEAAVLTRPLSTILQIDWYKAAYLVIILVGLVSRFWDIGSRVVSHDESLHTQYAYQYYIGDGYEHSPLMHGPFLFHLTALSYWLFGANDTTARIPVAIFGMIIVLMPHLLRHWIGRVGAIGTSFLLLISPYILYYSRYIRHDIYVITWALIIFIATFYYLRERKSKYLWWFAAGNALMFSTKEVSYIYVAIFGSFLVLRLANRLRLEPWFERARGRLTQPLLLLGLAALMIGGGFLGQRAVGDQGAAAATDVSTEGFAADPTETEETSSEENSGGEAGFRWLVIAGIVVLGVALFRGADRLRPQLDGMPEFDLIVLYATLLLPLTAALFTALAGWDPNDYAYAPCPIAGEQSLSAFSLMLTRLTTPGCWSHFFQQGLVRSGLFLVPALLVSGLVGLWWDRQRWPIAAAVFHAIFLVLYTSVFSNPFGWASGMVGSLGYWLAQQEVQRGNQPLLYYFFVVPLYGFLPFTLSLLAIRLWARKHRLNRITGYWLSVILLALFTWSLGGWLYNRPLRAVGEPTSSLPGLIAAAGILLIGVLYWFLVYQRQLLAHYDLKRSWNGFFDTSSLTDFVPGLIWWMVLTWVAYTVAGEKMPWLSTHFIIPMVLLSGWYLNERLRDLSPDILLSRRFLLQVALVILFIVALFLALGPLLVGEVNLGDQSLTNLRATGRVLGSLVIAGGLFYAWQRYRAGSEPQIGRTAVVLGVVALLSLLTIRFSYLATFPNADYTTEFLVYAHGAPATKSEVMNQVEMMSRRLYGDKSIDVAYDNDSSWPLTWYLREYPNRTYYGETPGREILDSPIVIAGSKNWDKVEPLLGDQYQPYTYTFLWWPMEKYRDISWDAIFGLQNGRVPDDPAVRRGLGNPGVRRALWDIFFYRDYQAFGEVFGGTYTAGQWPLRHDLRLYIRRDVLATLWDYGVNQLNAELPEDPYAEGELSVAPSLVVGSGQGSGEGQLTSPRNVAVGPDGNIYVADSGNHRIQVFDPAGNYLRSWGGFGAAPGLLNEPWGLAVDDEFVYVADTWNHRLQKFTHEGELVQTLGQSGTPGEGQEGGGLFFGPRDVILLPDNRLLVTDTGNHRLQLLDREGNFIRQIGNSGGQPGQAIGQFYEPVGLARRPDGGFYVTDTWNGRIQQFAPELLPLNEWAVDAWFSDSINNKPYIAVDNQGFVYTTDPEGYRILIFNENGEYVARFGQYGTGPDSFGLPTGITTDTAGNLYVTDAANHRVLKFAPLDLGPDVAPEEDADAVDEMPEEEESPDGAPEDAGDGEETGGEQDQPTPTPLG